MAEDEFGRGAKIMEASDRTRKEKAREARISHFSLVLTFLSVSPGNEYPDINVPT